jgi:hypothetical protein
MIGMGEQPTKNLCDFVALCEIQGAGGRESGGGGRMSGVLKRRTEERRGKEANAILPWMLR